MSVNPLLPVFPISSGPSLFMVLTREDAVMGWRALMGPTNPEEAKDQNPNCIRALFGQSTLDNAVHGSSNIEQAQKKIQEIFEVEVKPDGSINNLNNTDGETAGTGVNDAPPDTTES